MKKLIIMTAAITAVAAPAFAETKGARAHDPVSQNQTSSNGTEPAVQPAVEPIPEVLTAEPAWAPAQTTWTYISENPRESITWDGVVETGAVLPEDVTLTPVPDQEYDYVRINDEDILVDRDTREVLYVY